MDRYLDLAPPEDVEGVRCVGFLACLIDWSGWVFEVGVSSAGPSVLL